MSTILITFVFKPIIAWMKFEEIVQKFIDNQCYLTNGAGFLSKKWNVSKDTIRSARKEARVKLITHNFLDDEIKAYKGVGAENAIAKQLLEDIDRNKSLDVNVQNKPKGKLLKRWGKEGSWQESYSYDNEVAEGFNIDKVLSNINFNNIKPVNLPKVKESGRVLNLYLSDQHIGASVSNGLYTNHFDDIEYGTRMYKVFDKVVEFGKFDKINILFLGDTFDGQDGYTVKRMHKLPQNMSNNEAFETGIKVNMDFIDNLINNECAANYNIYCVSDSNHGGSMDYYLFKSLQEIIKYKYPEVQFTIAENFIDYFVEGVHTFMYTHGKDGKDMKFGLPLDLNDKTENFINQYIDEYEIVSKNIRLVKGDLHQDALSTGKKFSYRNVPSLFGSSGWIMKNYGNTKPGVGYDIFSPHKDDIMSGVIKLK